MTYTRQNVYANGGDFTDPTLLWYARGVKAMKERALADTTSWRFYAGIHGVDPKWWTAYGYLSPSDKPPAQADIDLYWYQCQHGSWYFLPWHRGYLLALEATIRDAVAGLGGPSDWALPYWNYFEPNESKLPPAFASRDWPDGGDNPLFVEQRWGPNDDGDVYVDLNQVNLKALTVAAFTGVANGGDPGFGGVDTGFSHSGRVHGDLETQPHDYVHVLVGGANPSKPNGPGLMSYPPTAGLDPIFYLHHANIDRLWEVWLRGPVSLGNPVEANWLKGPASVGQRAFAMPWPSSGGSKQWTYTPQDVGDLSTLDYQYDDLSPASVHPALAARLDAMQVSAKAVEGAVAMVNTGDNVEMVGANQQPLRLAGRAPVRAGVRMDGQAGDRMKANLAMTATDAVPGAGPAGPERVFLNLENVRGLLDAVAFKVYVNVPQGSDPADHPGQLAGSIGLFGVTQATAADEEHGGEGLTFVLEITEIVQDLHLRDELGADALDVQIVPVKHVPEEAGITIGRVTVFRQGA
jgi:tyrosinase